MTFVAPVSSSSVTKMTPLAVSGRWRPMTMPAVRTRRPCGARAMSSAVDEPALAQLPAQQRQRMAAQREAEPRGSRRRCPGLRWATASAGCASSNVAAGEELGQPLDAGDVPHRVVAMAGERRERIGVGERGQVAPVERRAMREIGDAREWRARARAATMRLRAGFGEAADQAQAEAQRRRSGPPDRFGRAGKARPRSSVQSQSLIVTSAGAPRRRAGAHPARAARARRSPSAAS